MSIRRWSAFSADVDWAKQNGARIERFNLAQQPMAFAENAHRERAFWSAPEQEALPLILVDGEVALAGRYPNRAELVPLDQRRRSACRGETRRMLRRQKLLNCSEESS